MLYFLIMCIIILIVVIIILYTKYKKCYNKLIEKNKKYILIKNKYDMVEYYYRNFKEGGNPYTTLRNISNLLKDVND